MSSSSNQWYVTLVPQRSYHGHDLLHHSNFSARNAFNSIADRRLTNTSSWQLRQPMVSTLNQTFGRCRRVLTDRKGHRRWRYIPGVAVKVETSAEDSKVRIQSGSLAIQLQEHDRCRGGRGCKSHVWELSEPGRRLIHHLRRSSGQRGTSCRRKWSGLGLHHHHGLVT